MWLCVSLQWHNTSSWPYTHWCSLSIATDKVVKKLCVISVFSETLSVSEFSKTEVLLALRPQRK